MNNIPVSSPFRMPLQITKEIHDFIASEIASDHILTKMKRWGKRYPWVLDLSKFYFQLLVDLPFSFHDKNIQCMCSKVYVRDFKFITIYLEGIFYMLLEDGTEDQPLLEVQFPDISQSGEGLTLAIYENDELEAKNSTCTWKKLSIWQSQKDNTNPSILTSKFQRKQQQRHQTPLLFRDLSSASYVQTYCICKGEDALRSVFFRFGNWCYSGTVELASYLSLVDLPHIIPAVRAQQKKLKFMCNISKLPIDDPFAKSIVFSEDIANVMEEEVFQSQDKLQNLASQLSAMGLEESVNRWIMESDSIESFFEFSFVPNDMECIDALKNIDLIAIKRYNPNGVVTICIYFGGTFYLSVLDAGKEQPLLDSRFPNIAAKGRGYQICSYPMGVHKWPQLRKLCIWQTVNGMENELKSNKPQKSKKTEAHNKSSESSSLLDDKTGSKLKGNHHNESNKLEVELSKEKIGKGQNDEEDSLFDIVPGEGFSNENRIKKEIKLKKSPTVEENLNELWANLSFQSDIAIDNKLKKNNYPNSRDIKIELERSKSQTNGFLNLQRKDSTEKGYNIHSHSGTKTCSTVRDVDYLNSPEKGVESMKREENNTKNDELDNFSNTIQTKDIPNSKLVENEANETKVRSKKKNKSKSKGKQTKNISSKNDDDKDVKTAATNGYRGPNHNLGAFHHLTPLTRPSQLQSKLKALQYHHENNNIEAPWDKNGKPHHIS